LKPVALSEVEQVAVERLSTGSEEFDVVLAAGSFPVDHADRRLARHREEHAHELDARRRSSAPATALSM
jgi:hypothetical protein